MVMRVNRRAQFWDLGAFCLVVPDAEDQGVMITIQEPLRMATPPRGIANFGNASV